MGASEHKCENESSNRLVIDRVSSREILRRLQLFMMPNARRRKVIWQDKNAKLLFDVRSTKMTCHPGHILIELSATTDAVKNARIVVPFRVGASIKDALKLGVTENNPRGEVQIITRWGKIIQNYLWNAIIEIGRENLQEHADDHPGKTLNALYAEKNQLVYVYSENLKKDELEKYIRETRGNLGPLDPDPIEIYPSQKRRRRRKN